MNDYAAAIPTKMMMFELLDEGSLDPKLLAETLISWIDEHEAKRFCEVNEIRLHYQEDTDC